MAAKELTVTKLLPALLAAALLAGCAPTENALTTPPVDPPSADTTAPVVNVSTPTSASTYSTSSSTLDLAGSASDNVGVTSVTWANDRGGSGSASGTGSWSISSLTLMNGSNAITITAQDMAGNSGATTLTVTVTSAPPPADTIVPTISINAPTSGPAFTSPSSTVNLSGAASDNTGVTQVTWASDRGVSGAATGSTGWSIASIALQSGNNVITVTAHDAAGNMAGDSLTVTYNPSTTSYRIQWDAVADARVSGYRLHYSVGPFGSGAVANIIDVGNATFTDVNRTILGVNAGTTVYFGVTAVGSGMESALSDPISSVIN